MAVQSAQLRFLHTACPVLMAVWSLWTKILHDLQVLLQELSSR